MSITFKVVLDKRKPNKKGVFPLKMRVYQFGDYKDHPLNIKIPESDWNKDDQEVSELNASCKIYNTYIAEQKAKLDKVILLSDSTSGRQLTIDDVFRKLNWFKETPERQSTALTDQPAAAKSGKLALGDLSIIQHGRKISKAFHAAGKEGNGTVYDTAINALENFYGKDTLSFNMLDFSFLEKWNLAMTQKGLKVNSRSNYMRTIRAIYNNGIRAKIADANAYPFKDFIIEDEKTPSRSLLLNEMQKYRSVDIARNREWDIYSTLFLLSFCLIGMNFCDLLTLKGSDNVDGRFVYQRRKTGKWYSVKITPEAEELIKKLRSFGLPLKGYLLPFISNKLTPKEEKREIGKVVKKTNEVLKEIAKAKGIRKFVTTYYARYAWSNLAKKVLGYSKDMIAEALGHEYGNKVTGIYLDDFDLEEIDKMNEEVVSVVWIKGFLSKRKKRRKV